MISEFSIKDRGNGVFMLTLILVFLCGIKNGYPQNMRIDSTGFVNKYLETAYHSWKNKNLTGDYNLNSSFQKGSDEVFHYINKKDTSKSYYLVVTSAKNGILDLRRWIPILHKESTKLDPDVAYTFEKYLWLLESKDEELLKDYFFKTKGNVHLGKQGVTKLHNSNYSRLKEIVENVAHPILIQNINWEKKGDIYSFNVISGEKKLTVKFKKTSVKQVDIYQKTKDLISQLKKAKNLPVQNSDTLVSYLAIDKAQKFGYDFVKDTTDSAHLYLEKYQGFPKVDMNIFKKYGGWLALNQPENLEQEITQFYQFNSIRSMNGQIFPDSMHLDVIGRNEFITDDSGVNIENYLSALTKQSKIYLKQKEEGKDDKKLTTLILAVNANENTQNLIFAEDYISKGTWKKSELTVFPYIPSNNVNDILQTDDFTFQGKPVDLNTN